MSNSGPVIFYGAGQYAVKNVEKLLASYEPVCFADKNVMQAGRKVAGFKVFCLPDCIKSYPDARFFITTDPRNKELKRDIQLSLLEGGVERDRIINFADYKYINGCDYLFHGLMFTEGGVSLCCELKSGYGYDIPRTQLPLKTAEAIADYDALRVQTIQALNKHAWYSFPNIACIGCNQAKYGWYHTDDSISFVNIASGGGDDKCNFRCRYCSAGFQEKYDKTRQDKTRQDKTRQDKTFVAMVKELIARGRINRDTEVSISCGEPALWPYLEEIRSFKESVGSFVFYSNCSIYSPIIASCLSSGYIVCSMDAGTPRTFARVKGVDCWDDVCKNIIRYMQFGEVKLKYIVLPEINDSEEDLNGFVAFVKEAGNPAVTIDRDGLRTTDYPEGSLAFMASLYWKLRAEDAVVSLPYGRLSIDEQEMLNKKLPIAKGRYC